MSQWQIFLFRQPSFRSYFICSAIYSLRLFTQSFFTALIINFRSSWNSSNGNPPFVAYHIVRWRSYRLSESSRPNAVQRDAGTRSFTSKFFLIWCHVSSALVSWIFFDCIPPRYLSYRIKYIYSSLEYHSVCMSTCPNWDPPPPIPQESLPPTPGTKWGGGGDTRACGWVGGEGGRSQIRTTGLALWYRA